MSKGLNTAARNNQINFVTAQYDAGSGPGVLEFYTGTRPATGAAIGGATLIATATFSAVSFPNAANGTASANAITGDATVDAGTPTWARGKDSDGNFVEDLDVGIAGSGADIILNAATFEQDAPLTVASYVNTAGNA